MELLSSFVSSRYAMIYLIDSCVFVAHAAAVVTIEYAIYINSKLCQVNDLMVSLELLISAFGVC